MPMIVTVHWLHFVLLLVKVLIYSIPIYTRFLPEGRVGDVLLLVGIVLRFIVYFVGGVETAIGLTLEQGVFCRLCFFHQMHFSKLI